MWMKQWMNSISVLCANPWIKFTALSIYYLAILLTLIFLYGKGNFTTPPFVYQGF